MATLKKYQSMVNPPQPSGLNIKVNKDTQPFNAPIELYGQRMEHDDKLALDDLDNKIELAKLENKSEQDFLKEQETMFKKRNKTLFDNVLTSEKIALIEFENNLRSDYRNNPTGYKEKLDEYVKVKLNSGLFPDPTRILKFQEKATSLGVSGLNEISNNVDTLLENNSWEGLNLLAEKNSSIIKDSISQIYSMKDIANHKKLYAKESKDLEGTLVNFLQDHGYRTDKTEADILNVLDQWKLDHDRNFLEHILTNVIMKPDDANSVAMAEAVWKAYKSGIKLKKFDYPYIVWDEGTGEFYLDILNRTTYDQHPLPNKEKIEDQVDTAMGNQLKKWKLGKTQVNKEYIGEQNIVRADLLDKNNINSIKNVTAPKLSETEIKNLSMEDDGDGNLVLNQDLVNELTEPQDVAEAFDNIILQLRKDGDVMEAVGQMQRLDMTLIGYDESYSPKAVLLEGFFQQNTVGINYNTTEIFGQIAQSYISSDQTQHVSLQAMAADIKKFMYFPQQMVDNLHTFAGLNITTEEDKNMLLSMAIVKVNTLGFNNVGNLNTNGKDIAGALDEVWRLNRGDRKVGLDKAIESWMIAVNPNFESQRKRKEAMSTYVKEKTQFEVEGYLKGRSETFWIDDIKEDFADVLDKAIARENTIDVPFYWTWGVNRIRQGFGMKDKEGKRSLDNIVKNQNTFIRGTKNNLRMTNSAYKQFRVIFDQIAWGFLNVDDPTPQQLDRAYGDAFIESIKQMTNTGYYWSGMLWEQSQTTGMVLTRNSPEKLTGMNTEELNLNVTAYVYNHLRKMDINEQSWHIMGAPWNSVDETEYDDYLRNFFQLAEDGHIKLVEDTTTVDRENVKFHIMMKNQSGDWKMVMDGTEPVSWLPNTVFTDSGGKHSTKTLKEILIRDMVTRFETNNQQKYSPSDKEKLIDILASQQWLHLMATEFGDKWQDIFKSDEDMDIDTISEIMTKATSEFEFKVKEVQNELNFKFEDEMEAMVLTHKVSYDETIPQELSREAKFKYVKEKHNKNVETFNEIYNDIGVVIHPKFQFVLTDIIDAIGPEHVNKDSDLYHFIQNEKWRYARQEIMRLQPLFKNYQRYQSLLMMWGIEMNTQ